MTTRSWIRRLFARKPRTIRKDRVWYRLGIETLEDRLTPSTLGTNALVEGQSTVPDSVIVNTSGAWSASSNAGWLHTNSSGMNSGLATFSFDSNMSFTRVGTLTIAGQTLTVTQAGSGYRFANPLTTLDNSGVDLPYSVAVDGSGNVYVADPQHDAVQEWHAATGQVTTLVSTGTNSLTGVAVDGSGNVYVAVNDIGVNAIKEWHAATGQATTLVSSGLNSPGGVAVDGSGNVYIADTLNLAIKELPRAFVPSAAAGETAAAGSDVLAPVLPATELLTGVFAPNSNQSWLTIGSTANGVVHFSFTENTTAALRTAQITVLGQPINVFQAPPLIVGTLADNESSSPLSLRRAVEEANNEAVGHLTSEIIVIPLSLYTVPVQGQPDPNTIRLGTELPVIASGLSLTIRAAVPAGGRVFSVSGEGRVRVIKVHAGGALALENLTLTNGRPVDATGAPDVGGAVFNAGSFTLTNSAVTNSSALVGGGIANAGGTVTISGSTLSGNSATGIASGHGGGGIFNASGGTVTISGSTLSGNSASDVGGGVYNAGTLTVSVTTLLGNVAVAGGGIENAGGTVTISGSTLSGNSATSRSSGGGGIENDGGTVTISGSTLSHNSASFGGGILNFLLQSTLTINGSTLSENIATFGGGIENTGTLNLADSIVAGNTVRFDGPDISNVMPATVGGFSNLIGSADGFSGLTDGSNGNRVGLSAAQVGLAPFGYYSPGTQTYALLPGSLALGAGAAPATLAAALAATGTTLSLVSPTYLALIPGSGVLLVDAEQLLVTAVSGSSLTVTCGYNGTAVAAHTLGAGVYPAFDQRGFARLRGGHLDSGAFEVQPAGQLTRLVIQPPPTPLAGTPFAATVAALDDAGQPVAGYRGTVHFSSTDPQATLPADYAFTAGDNGVHTFGVVLRTAGNRSVTATDHSINSNAAVTVAAAADHCTLTTTAANPDVAGTPFTVTVTTQDAYGNTATGYRGTVHFSSTDPQAGFPADYAFTATDYGVRTFGVVLRTAGNRSVTATDTVTGSITGNATANVVAAAASQFGVSTSAASPDIAGTPFDVTVTALDPYGNTATSYTGTVTFTSADPYGASLPTDYTFQASDQGVATFSGVTALYTAGAWDVTATATQSGITGTASVNVLAAPAVAFQIVTPASATSGTPFDVTVIAVDPYGNTDTNYTGTVTFSTSDGDPGVVLPPDYTFQLSDAGMVTVAGEVTLITSGDQTLTATDTDSGITGTATITVLPGTAPGTGGFGTNPAVVLREWSTTPAAVSERPLSSDAPAGTAARFIASTERGSAPSWASAVGAAGHRAAVIDHIWSDPADLLLSRSWMDDLPENGGL